MTQVHTRDISVSYGALTVLEKLNLRVPDGQFLVLLGPSGCGKSTLLNAIAGLQPVSDGQVWIGDRNVTWDKPKDRGIAMVFQSYALYPKMTVRQNLSFGLKVAGMAREEVAKRVQRAAEALQLEDKLDRCPGELSGGQRQRVAIGRVLVRDVSVYLFDEPLSNLDAQLRDELRREIKRLHRRMNSTSIYVTHDQVEAMTLADRIAVMSKGRIEQLGTPEEIYERPATRYVASFIGSPAMNFVDGTIDEIEGQQVFRRAGMTLSLKGYPFASAVKEGEATLGIRPEHFTVGTAAEGLELTREAVIDLVEPLGSETLVWCSIPDGSTLGLKLPVETRPREGENLTLGVSLCKISLFDKESGRRL